MSFNRYALKLAKIVPAVFRHWAPTLRSVAIEPTSACNLKCEMCYSQSPELFELRKAGIMQWESYTKIVDELAEMQTVNHLALNFGGESLLHKRFIDMVQYAAKARRFTIGFNTNGMLLNETIARSLVECRVDHICFSLDGLKEWHEQIRRGSKFEVVEKNILRLKEIRGLREKPRIVVNLTETRQGAEEVDAFTRHWARLVDRAEAYPRLNEDLTMDLNSRFFEGENLVHHKRCTWPVSYMAILWNGDVTTCCHDINGINKKLFENVLRDGVRGVWESEKFKRFRYAAFTNSFESGSLCHGCSAWKVSLQEREERRGDMITRYCGLGKFHSMA